MAKRIFVSFAIEDRDLRNMLRGQGRNPSIPFKFTDMSVKEPWDRQWKSRCRTRIRGCAGMVAIITRHTARAHGQLWEIGFAYGEGIPAYPIFGSQHNRPAKLPAQLAGKRIYNWTWDNITRFINRV